MDPIHTATVDGRSLSHHRSRAGAATAIADEVRSRMERFASTRLADEEHEAVRSAMMDRERLALEVGRGMDGTLPGVSVERAHQIAFGVNRTFGIETAELRD